MGLKQTRAETRAQHGHAYCEDEDDDDDDGENGEDDGGVFTAPASAAADIAMSCSVVAAPHSSARIFLMTATADVRCTHRKDEA